MQDICSVVALTLEYCPELPVSLSSCLQKYSIKACAVRAIYDKMAERSAILSFVLHRNYNTVLTSRVGDDGAIDRLAIKGDALHTLLGATRMF